jgi:hypothetical protein
MSLGGPSATLAISAFVPLLRDKRTSGALTTDLTYEQVP